MILEARDVSCGYRADKPILSHISFTVESGEICCVLGPNGCGKTTLFKSILGILPPLSGSIRIDEEDISSWPSARKAEAIAYVSQAHVPPFPYRVIDAVLLGRIGRIGYTGKPTRRDYRIVEAALDDLGIYELRNKPYTELSGGELQLTMIARALAQQPKMLILDEPTAALDYGNAVRVISKIRALAARGYAILMTTHSPDHAFMCRSRVLLLQKDAPMKFGRAIDIITEKNMKQAYGVNIKLVEFVNERDEIMRMCAPVF